MNEFCYIVMIKLKLLQLEKLFNIFQITCYQVIHTDNMITFVDETIAEMRTKKTGSTGY